MFPGLKPSRDFILIHPAVGFISIPVLVIWLEGKLRPPRRNRAVRWLGLPLIALGCALSSWSAALFVTQGRATPDPNNPPQVLVVAGPYRYSRNPMAAGALLALIGLGLWTRSLLLLSYTAAFAAVLHLYHVRTEEPELITRFGPPYIEYQQRVPRWLPRRPRAEKTP